MKLLYLHGFISSPASSKATSTKYWFKLHAPQIDYCCPFLSPYPQQTIELLERKAEQLQGQDVLIIGSSMGGYYGTWLAERLACKAVLVNPAVSPWRWGRVLLGEQRNHYTGEKYRIEERHLEALKPLEQPLRHPENLWLLLQTGDQVLDYRLAQQRYRECRTTVEQGGDHGFTGFERYLPQILQFWKQKSS